MTSSLENSAPLRQPRTPQAPSSRNQQIYLDYQIGQRQTDLAEKYKLTQCRISQIIRRVEKWLASTSNLEPGTLNSAAAAQLAHRVQYDRLSEAGRLALQHFHEQQKIVTHKKGARAGKDFNETTERLLPPNLQCLKVVAQTSAQLTRLSSRNTPCAVGPAPHLNTGYPLAAQTLNPEPRTLNPPSPLSREQVEAWLLDQYCQAARSGKVPQHWNAKDIVQDVVNGLVGESTKDLALHALANDAGKKIVQRRPYEEKWPPIPPRDGWYYGMYDENGGLVAWLDADQLAGAIPPEYPPVSRDAAPVGNALRGVPADDTASGDHSPLTHSPLSPSSTTSSSTSPATTDPPQPTSAPALTSISPETSFPTPYESQPYDLESTQPTLYQKGCSNCRQSPVKKPENTPRSESP